MQLMKQNVSMNYTVCEVDKGTVCLVDFIS